MPQKDIDTELLLAVFAADLQRSRELIRGGADVNAVGDRKVYSIALQTPLGIAIASAGQEKTTVWQEFSNLLPEVLPEVGHRDFSAKRSDYLSIAGELLRAGADPNKLSCHRSPLSSAAFFGDVEATRLLLDGGASPTAICVSPLSKLSERKGRRVTEPGYYNTALHEASERGHLEIVKMLIQAGADLFRTDHEGRTSVEVAKAAGHQKVVECLAECGR